MFDEGTLALILVFTRLFMKCSFVSVPSIKYVVVHKTVVLYTVKGNMLFPSLVDVIQFFLDVQYFSYFYSTMTIALHRKRLALLLILHMIIPCLSLISQLPKFSFNFPNSRNRQRQQRLEDQLLEAISKEGKRLANSEDVSKCISELERSGLSIPEPAISPQVYGRWRLLYTTNADTSSPIQRKAVDSKTFPIYQDILFNEKGQLIVSQVVKFSDNAKLAVDAVASTAAYPLPELTERQSPTTLGLNILGTSLVGDEAKPDPSRPNSRIDFVFDEGKFDFGSIQLPYPVPFRLPLLRDVVKGWIDITYLSDRLRISRGNKGTTFVLARETEEGKNDDSQ